MYLSELLTKSLVSWSSNAETRGVKSLAELSDNDWAQAHLQVGPEVRAVLGVENAINAFRSYGSTAPVEVERQLQHWKQRLDLNEP